MNKYLFLIFYFYCFQNFGQNLYMKIEGSSSKQTKSIDSLGYNIQHKDAKSILEESNSVSDKLMKSGYLESQLLETKKINDSTFYFLYQLGKKTNFIHIYIGRINEAKKLNIFENKNDSILLPFSESETFLNSTLKKIEAKGYSMAKIKLTNLKKRNTNLFAELDINLGKLRQVNDIIVNGYEKFPEGHKKSILRHYRNKVFNQENLENLYKDFQKFRFIKQVKYPEILFAKDSTKIYVYVEKTKSNSFDGFIGFTNSESNKIIFNGYLDLVLNNIMNSGEKLSLYWKSNGKDQKTFNLGVEVPYIFNSRLGLKTQLNIFKQDSTFQNTLTAIDLGYYFNYTTRLYLGYQSTESSDIKNSNTSLLSDFTNSFVTTNFEFVEFKSDDYLFPEKSNCNIKVGTGKRNSKFQDNNQFFASVFLKHNIYLNNKNCINIKSQNYYLQSDDYIINELYRFGGINSIRGFNENSLQGNMLTSLLTEYRYLLSPSLYMHSIFDYGYYKDTTSNFSNTLLGLGFGFGMLTKNGLINLVYANGSTKDQTIKMSNSIIHISFKASF